MGEEPGAFRIHIYVLARGGEARQRYWDRGAGESAGENAG